MSHEEFHHCPITPREHAHNRALHHVQSAEMTGLGNPVMSREFLKLEAELEAVKAELAGVRDRCEFQSRTIKSLTSLPPLEPGSYVGTVVGFDPGTRSGVLVVLRPDGYVYSHAGAGKVDFPAELERKRVQVEGLQRTVKDQNEAIRKLQDERRHLRDELADQGKTIAEVMNDRQDLRNKATRQEGEIKVLWGQLRRFRTFRDATIELMAKVPTYTRIALTKHGVLGQLVAADLALVNAGEDAP